MNDMLRYLLTLIVLFGLSFEMCAEPNNTKVIRQNIENGINVLKQTDFSEENTVYIIHDQFDLNEATIEVPSECVLLFDGGCFANGTIVGNETSIYAENRTIFSKVMLGGSFIKCKTAYSDWFDFDTSGKEDSSSRMEQLCKLGREVLMSEGEYLLGSVNIDSDVCIIGTRGVIFKGIMAFPGRYSFHKRMLCIHDVGSFEINNIIFEGDDTYKWSAIDDSLKNGLGAFVSCDKVNKVHIHDCVFRKSTGIAQYALEKLSEGQLITVRDVKEAIVENCEFCQHAKGEMICYHTVDLAYDETSLVFNNNYIHDMVLNGIVGNSILGDGYVGTIYCTSNRVMDCYYNGSAFNLYAKRVYINNNVIDNCAYSGDVFDTTEFGKFYNDYVECCNNCINSNNGYMLDTNTSELLCVGNIFKGGGGIRTYELYGSTSYYDDVNPETMVYKTYTITDNNIDCSFFDDRDNGGKGDISGRCIYIRNAYSELKSIVIKNNTLVCDESTRQNRGKGSLIKLMSVRNIVIVNNILKSNVEGYDEGISDIISINKGISVKPYDKFNIPDRIIENLEITDNTVSDLGNKGNNIKFLSDEYSFEKKITANPVLIKKSDLRRNTIEGDSQAGKKIGLQIKSFQFVEKRTDDYVETL